MWPAAIAALEEMRGLWAAAGHPEEALDAIVLTGGVVLDEHEPAELGAGGGAGRARAPRCCCTAPPTRR